MINRFLLGLCPLTHSKVKIMAVLVVQGWLLFGRRPYQAAAGPPSCALNASRIHAGYARPAKLQVCTQHAFPTTDKGEAPTANGTHCSKSLRVASVSVYLVGGAYPQRHNMYKCAVVSGHRKMNNPVFICCC